MVIRLLQELRGEIGALRAGMNPLREEMPEFKREVRSEVSMPRADLVALERKADSIHIGLKGQIAGLRRTAVLYRSSVTGHGILISDLEARVSRVERHLDLPAMDPH